MAKKDTKATGAQDATESTLPKVPPTPIAKIERLVEFDNDDLIQFGKDIVNLRDQYKAIKEEKKQKNADYKLELDGLESQMGKIDSYIKEGKGLVAIECEVYYNVPNTGRKQYVRKGTQEVIEEVDMTQEELFERNQGSLDF